MNAFRSLICNFISISTVNRSTSLFAAKPSSIKGAGIAATVSGANLKLILGAVTFQEKFADPSP